MSRIVIIVVTLLLLVGGAGAVWVILSSASVDPILSEAMQTRETLPLSGKNDLETKAVAVNAKDIAGVAPQFTFQANIPASWKAESISGIEAISFYDPLASGNTSLEKSQIFIRHFTASQFLTLSTVTIHSRESLIVAGRPAVRYDISKKTGVLNFANQPLWRNERHVVTDIRVSDSSPSVFYVIAKRPDLDQGVYEDFLNSLTVKPLALTLVAPASEFDRRITGCGMPLSNACCNCGAPVVCSEILPEYMCDNCIKETDNNLVAVHHKRDQYASAGIVVEPEEATNRKA